MKKLYLLILFLALLSATAVAQAQTRIGKDYFQYEELTPLEKITTDELYQASAKRHQQLSNQYSVPDTICVVVHVLYANSSENIPDSNIYNVIERLNQDFRRLNSDSTNTPLPFNNIAGRSNFVFQLARQTPEGAATSGIVRVPTTNTYTSISDAINPTSGGDAKWPNCLNIYTSNIDPSTGASGFGALNNNHCLIDYTYMYFASRVPTHEVAHCFGLNHIWGQTDQECTEDDNIADTPQQFESSQFSSILTFPTFDNCTQTGNGIAYMNYMNYYYAKNFFTAGQMQAMTNTLTGNLNSIVNSPLLQPLYANDGGCVQAIGLNGIYCSTIAPKIVIKNFGVSPLTSINIHWKIDNGPVQTQTWIGSLNNFENDTITIPSTILSPGNHTVTIYTTQPNNTPDLNTVNDTLNVVCSNQTNSFPYSQGFESSIFPPSGWTVNSQNPTYQFARTTAAHSSGSASMYFTCPLIVQNLYVDASFIANLSNVSNPIITYKLAYTYLTGFPSDTFDILVSRDCGSTFIPIRHQYGSTLVSCPPPSSFVPNWVPLSTEWRADSISLAAFANENDIIIKFKIFHGFGLQFYLDDINLGSSIVSVANLAKEKINIYPNPSNGSFIITISNEKEFDLEIYNSIGKLVYHDKNLKNMQQVSTELTEGYYKIVVKQDDKRFSSSIVIQQ